MPLTGRVIRKEDGRPLPGVSLWAAAGVLSPEAPPPPSATSGADGSFVIPDPPVGPIVLYACAAGFLPWVEAFHSQPEPVEVVLETAAELRGRVLGAEGEPLAGVSVKVERSAAPVPWGSHLCPIREKTATDGQGRFSLGPIESDEYLLWAITPDRRGGGIRDVEAPAGQVVEGLEIWIRPAGLIVRVVDPNGRPVSGAEVSVASWREPPAKNLWQETTAADGIARLVALPEEEHLWLHVEHAGFAPVLQEEELKLGERREVEVRLQPGGALAGQVLDEAGRPVADAEVEVWWKVLDREPEHLPDLLEDRPRRRTRTDPQGRLGVRDLPAGEVELSVRHPSFTPLRTRPTAPAGRSGDLGPLVLRRGATLTGTVTDPAGRPLSGVRLTAGASTAATGTDGSFVLTGLEPGPLRAEAEGYLTELRTLCRFDAPLSLTLWPRESRRIPGPDGTPVQGAGLHVAAEACGSSEAGVLAVRAFDPGGWLLEEATVEVSTEAEGISNLDRGQSTGDGWFLVSPRPAGPASGPAGPASVHVEVPGYERLEERIELGPGDVRIVAVLPREDVKECDPAAPPEPAEPREPPARSTVLAIEAPRGEGAVDSPVVWASENPWGSEDPVAVEPARLRGRVLDPDGQPVEGATVEARPADRSGDPWAALLLSSRPLAQTRTDARGRFSLAPLDPAWVEVVAYAGASTGSSGLVRAAAGATVDVEVRLERGAAVSGRVLDETGMPVEGASVSTGGASTMAAADGSFRFIGLPAGTARLRVRKLSYQAQEREIELGPGETRVDLVLTPDPRSGYMPVLVRGRVTGPDGAPVAGAHITTLRNGATRSAADGSFELRLPLLQPEEITVRHPGLAAGSILVPGAPAGQIEIRLAPDAAITGRVLGLLEGEPGPDDHVRLLSPAGWFPSVDLRADGTFEASQLPPGTWELTAWVSGREAHATVVLPPGQKEVRADLHLPPLHPVSGRVLDELGRPLDGVDLLAWPGGHGASPTEGTTRADGSFDLLLLDGPHNLHVSKKGFRVGRLSDLQVEGGPVTGLEIRLERATVLRGHLLGLSPGEKPSLRIEPVRPGQGTLSHGRIALDRYSIPGLGPGLWKIEASTRSCTLRRTIEIPPGATEMELDLDFTLTEAEP